LSRRVQKRRFRAEGLNARHQTLPPLNRFFSTALA
jgi:hypothetical protein